MIQGFQSLALRLAGIGLMMVALSPYASATPVTYSTTGVLTITDNQTTLPGGLHFTDYIQYTGSGTVDVNAPTTPAVATGSLGSIFVADAEGTGITPTGTFTITINQTAPPGVGSLGATFSGTISRPVNSLPNEDTLELTFAQTSVNIAGIEYTLTGLTGADHNELDLGLYNNTITADISQLPEPTLMALTGFGFVGLCFVALRRRRSA